MELKHHNFTLDGSDIPLFVGDRWYGQDILRDFYSNKEYSGRIEEDLLGFQEKYTSNIVINGLTSTQGAGHTLTWTAGRVKVTHTLKTPTDWSSLPPSMTSHTIPIIIDIPAVSNQAITGADTGGVNTNYAKLSYNESSTSSRARAKKAGSYDSEVSESYTFTCNSTPPTADEVAFATFTSDGATLAFTNDEPRWNKIKTVTTTYTAKVYDKYISGSGTFTITLPPIADAKGQTLIIENGSTGILTIEGNASETIEGNLFVLLTSAQKKHVLYCNGIEWKILNKYTILNMDINSLSIVNSAGDVNNDFDISCSECMDSTGLVYMPELAATTKLMDAVFAAGSGNGGFYTSSKANNTIYYIIKILKDSDGSVDVYGDISPTAANKPAGYTYYRVVGAWITDASANNEPAIYTLIGRNIIRCDYLEVRNDRPKATAGATTRQLLTVSAPIGSTVKLIVQLQVYYGQTGSPEYLGVGSTFETDVIPTTNNSCCSGYDSGVVGVYGICSGAATAIVDSNRQVFWRMAAFVGSYVDISTKSWMMNI